MLDMSFRLLSCFSLLRRANLGRLSFLAFSPFLDPNPTKKAILFALPCSLYGCFAICTIPPAKRTTSSPLGRHLGLRPEQPCHEQTRGRRLDRAAEPLAHLSALSDTPFRHDSRLGKCQKPTPASMQDGSTSFRHRLCNSPPPPLLPFLSFG